MKRSLVRFITTAAVAGAPATAFAHPGHGHTDPHSLVHHLVEPVHGWLLIGGLAGLVTLGSILRLRRVRQRAQK